MCVSKLFGESTTHYGLFKSGIEQIQHLTCLKFMHMLDFSNIAFQKHKSYRNFSFIVHKSCTKQWINLQNNDVTTSNSIKFANDVTFPIIFLYVSLSYNIKSLFL